MRRVELLTAACVSAAAVGAAAALAVSSGDRQRHVLAARVPAVEVRTETVRRTINVYRRDHPHHVASGSGGQAPTAARHAGTRVSPSPAPIARASGTRAAPRTSAPATARRVVHTRSSGANPALGKGGGTSQRSRATAPRTRSSGTSAVPRDTASSRPPRTRASGGGDGEGHSGHDD